MFQIHQFLNVGVLVEKNFVTSRQIGELVVVVLVVLCQLAMRIKVMTVVLEQLILDDMVGVLIVDVDRFALFDEPQIDWIDEDEEMPHLLLWGIDEVEVDDEVEGGGIDDIEEWGEEVILVSHADEIDEILDFIERVEKVENDDGNVATQKGIDILETDETVIIDESDEKVIVVMVVYTPEQVENEL